ncbi:MAG: potassium transporter TrkG [Eubacteriales bacterium]|nr:potassium transporter TrkG [Eubacteriales bacterium]MDD3290078.1 potassium transporter TrkG [Eubacteriales bacterium]MDD3863055.1 potassium transporter TrkG [Eubacteriales bacterium]MDD4445087.1 potassium transporter TrkG [Eubacteriales bacterium]
MALNKAAIIRIAGFLAVVIGLAMLPSFFMAFRLKEEAAAHGFGVSAAVVISIGMSALWFTRSRKTILRIRDGMLVVFVGWLIASLTGTFPYMISGVLPSFPDAFFESVSGFTTTGATVFHDIEALPRSIIFWRSFCQWLGGMGILVFVISVLPALGINGYNILRAETPGLSLQKLDARHQDSARKLYLVYIVLTLVQILLLFGGKMPLFDAIIFSFGSIASSGLTGYNNGLMHFDSAYAEAVIAVFMILSCVNFSLYYCVLKRDFLKIRKNTELKAFLLIMAVAAILVSLNLRLTDTYETPQALRYGVFQTISFMTTTGNASADFISWPSFSKTLLMILTFIGGSSASTGGALKVIRIVILSKLIWRSFSMRIHPNAVISIKLQGKTLDTSTVNAIVAFFFTYMAVFLFGAFVISLDVEDMRTAFLASSAMLSNTGASFGQMGIFANYEYFAAPTKLFMSLLMLTGRLEIYTVLLLGSKTFWNPNK